MNPKRDIAATASCRPCLIGGTGRSGTTILKRIFAAHPLVANVPEWRFSIDPDGLVDFYVTFSNSWSPYLFDVRLKRLVKMLKTLGRDHFLARLYAFFMQKTQIERYTALCLVPRYLAVGIERGCPHFFEFVNKLKEDLTEFSYPGLWNGSHFFEKNHLHYAPPFDPEQLAAILGKFWRAVIEDTCQKQQADFFVEDNTWNMIFFDKTLELLPDAKLVHVYRDPRDVVASYSKQRWSPRDPVKAAHWYMGLINRWFEVRDGLDENSFMEVALENLVADPQVELEKICDFWGIPWDDTLLQTDLSKSHTGRWTKDFSETEIKAVNAILEREIDILGVGSN